MDLHSHEIKHGNQYFNPGLQLNSSWFVSLRSPLRQSQPHTVVGLPARTGLTHTMLAPATLSGNAFPVVGAWWNWQTRRT